MPTDKNYLLDSSQQDFQSLVDEGVLNQSELDSIIREAEAEAENMIQAICQDVINEIVNDPSTINQIEQEIISRIKSQSGITTPEWAPQLLSAAANYLSKYQFNK